MTTKENENIYETGFELYSPMVVELHSAGQTIKDKESTPTNV